MLARRANVPTTEITRAALQGRLGPLTRLGENLLICPTEVELEATYPDYARRRIGAEHGWHEAEVVQLRELAK